MDPPARAPGARHDGERSGGVRIREAAVALLAIALPTVLAYSNTLDASFHFDDIPNIVRNPALRDLGAQWPPSGSRWLGSLSFALNYRLGGLEVFGYHLVNLCIHVCNGLLVAWLAALTLRTPALRDAEAGPLVRRHLPLAAGLLFALHPLATQAVTYVVQRFASLATLFYLLSLATYARARLSLEAPGASRGRAAALYSLSLLAAAAAMRTKEIAFTLPLAAAGYDLLHFRGGRRALLLGPIAAIALLLLPFGALTHDRSLSELLDDSAAFAAETREISRAEYLLTQPRVVVRYLQLLVLPVGQNLDYDFRVSRSLADPGVLLALAILATLAGCALSLLIRAREANRAPGALLFLGFAWFVLTASVESSVVPIRDVIFEHRAYLPSAGAAVALATALLWLVERLRLSASPGVQAAVALLVVGGPLGFATHARNAVWKDELSLWTDVVAKSPEKPRPRNALGEAYFASGRIDEAAAQYREALRLDPRYADARNNLGEAHRARGRLDDAVEEYREALRLEPAMAEAHNNLCAAHGAQGRLEEAARECRHAIRLGPPSAEAHTNLGNVHLASGRIEDALAEYREAVRLDPGLADARVNLGNAHLARGEIDEAVGAYREALRLAPGMAEARDNLRRALGRRTTGVPGPE